MVQVMAELMQSSDNGESANFPLSPYSGSSSSQNRGNLSPDLAGSSESLHVDSDSEQSEPERVQMNLTHVGVRPSISEPMIPILIPRTVPCVVLTHPLSLNPGLPLTHSPTKGLRESGSVSPETPFNYSNRSSGVASAKNEEKSLNLTTERKEEESVKIHDKVVPSKKLAFGIDRILSEESENSGLNLMKSKGRQGHPIEFNLKSYHSSSNNSEDHHHHNHQGPADSYANQCSECFFLARYCRRIQFPLTSTPVGSTFSWMPPTTVGHSSAEAASSLLPPSGFTQHPHLPYGLTSNNFSNISPMVSCNTTGNGRRKRSWSRAVFSNLQRKGLEKRFQLQKYITKPDRRQLAATLGLTDAQVKVWFQNRRMKWRHSKEGKQGSHTTSEEPSAVSSDKK